MNRKTILATLAGLCVGVAVCLAADAHMGTWKLNEAKSKLPSAAKNNSVMYEAAGDSIKVTVDGVLADGTPAHNEWTGKFDGKDYAVTGDPNSDMRAYKKINDKMMELTVKTDGKTTVTGKIVLAADGKSRTVTTTATDAAGKKTTSMSVYDKQ